MRSTLITVALLGLLVTACGAPTSGQAAPAGTSAATTSVAKPATGAACRAADLKALPTIPTPPPHPGGVALRVSIDNAGDDACTLTGVSRVALSDGSAPQRSLTVKPDGTADPITLGPGEVASIVLTFDVTPEGKCASGAEPSRQPVLLVGVPDDLVATKMADGSAFLQCGDTVIAAPFEAF
jgi:archaellum component FlaG (FlaF/FlaG flagellin family)